MSTAAIDKAMADASRMESLALKMAAPSSGQALIAAGRSFDGKERLSVNTAQEQLRNFKGWVWSAIRLIASRIAGQSVHVARKPALRGRKSTGQEFEPLESHVLLDALADPSDLMTAWQLMFSTVASLEITGRSLWWIQRGKRNGRDMILPIPIPWIVEVDSRRTV